MSLNPKKSITLRNRTNYFNPNTTRVKVRFASPNSYNSRKQKIEGYETRLYWQYRYCEDHDGQTFFYTLTYNDANMPKQHGMNCFDYEDLRDLLTGGFQKQLLRKYGTKFKYFIGAELGDGKGSRGMHNNPHYHVLFFLEPANNPRFPYVKIDPEDFRHLVRLYWQGFDEDADREFHDYREALKGIAREGEHVGKVVDFRACMYCAKYVTKDAKLVANEHIVERNTRFKLKNEYKPHKDPLTGLVDFHNANIVAREFFNDVIKPMYNTPLNAKHTKWSFTNSQLIQMLAPKLEFATFLADEPDGCFRWYEAVKAVCDANGLWQSYCDYRRTWLEPKVKEAVNEWRNRFSNKVRISHGVGDYALDTIDPLNPTVQVPDSKKGFKNRPIGMYYYRKLYLNVVKDAKNQNIYVLNDQGKEYKLYQLSTRIEKMAKKAKSNLNIVMGNEALFEKMRESDVNTEVFCHFPEFLQNMNYLLNENNIEEITTNYAIYKLIYEDRFFAYHFDGNSNIDCFPPVDYVGDYERFLVPSFYSVSYNPLMLSNFMENPPEGYLPYQMHPYFLRYSSVFRVLDMCADYFFVQKDNRDQKEAEERAAVKRFHNIEKVKQFYRRFEK